ncbi:restriction modification system DNA specificity domain-containing protein [Vibrio cincinnatiensis]|uniref:Type I restriction enzyme, S subunit n=1 Tax=Vibrio cincinnatiensis DSM 19608 TaxID=1123491 RepID=A0A1T4SBU5_VIBCI|nr:restriction endonuclease subunit S [Vibrio cincinnatiensis]SKA25699.1 type I restriction enzyme, S subunit [Vibrio cincinnatiensis DSM 19608]SUP49063.1 restriction modification system DNA specificity domain-containing protein [Vibrio cincinnatiensis]
MSNLPSDWKWEKLGNLTSKILGGGTPSKSVNGYFNGDIPFMTVKDMRVHRPVDTIDKISKEALDSSSAKLIEPNTLIISTRMGLGKVVKTSFPVAINQDLKAIFLKDSVCQRFFELQYRFLASHIESLGAGTTVKGIRLETLRDIELAVAPLEEQVLIADKLDSVLEKLEIAKSRLEKIPLLLKRFRMSVLSAAVSGELTEEWRDANNADDWEYVSLKQVGKGFNYGSSAKSKKEGSVPVLRMGNLQDGKLDWSDLVYTSDEKEIEKYKLEAGDVLFNRTNSPELVGKTSIYRGEREAIFAGYLIKVQGTERLNSEYLNIQLNSPHARDYCWQVKTDGVSQSNINAQKLKAYEFNLPSIEEQEEIVRVVSELLAKSDLVKKQYEAAKLRVDKLTQSILARAFRGELFEPFSDKAERVAQPQSEDVIDEQPTDREETTLEQADINSIQSRPTPKTVDDKSELLSQLKSAKKAMTAQQLFDSASVETFKAIDELFVELKRLLELKLIEKVGEGENCQFKATK